MRVSRGWSKATNLCLFTAMSAVIGFAANIAAASITDSDSFESPTTLGALGTQTGGTGWSSAWGAPANGNTSANVVAASMSAAGVIGGSQAVSVSANTGTSAVAANRALAVAFNASVAADQNIYVGYLIRHAAGSFSDATTNNTFGLHLSNGTNTTGAGVFNFGMRHSATATDANGDNGGNFFFLRNATGSGVGFGGGVTTGTDYYMVMKLTSDGTTYNSATVWLNPTSTANVDLPGGNGAQTITGVDSISHVLIRQAAIQIDDVFMADRIVVGTAWADVAPAAIPEPGSLSLLGCLGLVLLARRRRS